MIDFLTNRFSKLFHRRASIGDGRALAAFIDGNSAFVAQSALYGYIKTRAGLQYFRLFDDADFAASINMAKWNMYAACVGDLALFCGAHLHRRLSEKDAPLGEFISSCADAALSSHGAPPDAGGEYRLLAQEARARVAAARWAEIRDDESPFSHSPQALVHWAPVVDEHKKYDAPIVRNSVIFKWKEVRDKFRRQANVTMLEKEISNFRPPSAD